jgi:hypothetical protein
VFKTVVSPTEFLKIQENLDMLAVIDYLDTQQAVRVGMLGPVMSGAEELNQKRAEYVLQVTHDYGLDQGQAFTHYLFTIMRTDDIRQALRALGQDKRLSQTILSMGAVKALLNEREIGPQEYQDREERLSDAARGVG